VALRLLERIGRGLGFSPAGREVRVWTHSRPGEEDAVVVAATVVEVTERGALLELHEPFGAEGGEVRRVLAVPTESGWGLEAMWFSFIEVDAFRAHAVDAPIGRWWLRLGGGG
jgi:hypothetical protein